MIIASNPLRLIRTLRKSIQLKSTRCASTESTNHFDIIIAGGGMVGTTLACALGKNTRLSNIRILLLEASKEFKWSVSNKYSNRVVALNPNTQSLLTKIDVWKNVEAVRYGSVHKLQVWDALSDAMIAFHNDDFSERVAYIVENNLLIHAVTEEIKNVKNVQIINQALIKHCALPIKVDDKVNVQLEDGRTFSCDLLLGCDGAKSQVREAMGVQYLSWNYNSMGLVATLKLSETAEENVIGWQRFLPTGPVAILPLNSTMSSLVWSNTPGNVKRLLKLPEDQFVDELNTALWKVYDRSGIVNEAKKIFDSLLNSLNFPSNAVRQLPPNIAGIEEGSRAAFPLGFGHASNYVGKSVALVGDAAHRVHPLGGQGVNLGFGDVTCLNTILGEAVYSGRKLGNMSDLKQYETDRQRHNVPTMLALDSLHRLYTTDFTPVVLLRSLGLQLTHALTPIKVGFRCDTSAARDDIVTYFLNKLENA